MITLSMYSDTCRTHSRVSIQFDYLVYLFKQYLVGKKNIMHFLEGSHLSYLKLNNCCVKEDIIIISGHIICRLYTQ